jgi:polar amino acid transport system substrate-binding protein
MSFRKLAFALVVSSLACLGAKADDKVLKVGSTPTGIPFTFLDTKTNTIEGVMVDLIKEIGKDAGFKVEIEGMQFSTLIPSLTSNKIDIIAAAMYITPPRKEVIDFSGPVYTYGEGLIVP